MAHTSTTNKATSPLSRLASFKSSKKSTPQWPPPHWEAENQGTISIEPTPPAQQHIEASTPTAEVTQRVAEPTRTPSIARSTTATFGSHSVSPPPSTSRGFGNPNAPQASPTDRLSLANRLSQLIESLPLLSTEMSVTTADEDGPPVPSMVDQQLIQQLSSESVMNGTNASPHAQAVDNAHWYDDHSVWSILQHLSGRRKGKEDGQQGEFMMYAPLEPRQGQQPELAEWETVLEYVGDETPADPVPTAPTFETSTRHERKSGFSQREAQRWVPSRTQLSLQTFWWGFRIYLPPPVMSVLRDKKLKPAQRAAMLSTALKWLLERVPNSNAVPVQFRSGVKLLKKASPVLGAVGMAVTGAVWKGVEGQDTGMFSRRLLSSICAIKL